MSRLIKCIAPALFALAMVGCGPVEVRIGKEQGAKPLNGALVAKVPTTTFQCGDVITAMDTSQTFTVVSRVVSGGCEFTFDQDVEVVSLADYDAIKEFKAAVKFIHKVEVKLGRLEFFDDQGAKFDPETRIRDLEMKINGEVVLDTDALKNLPKIMTLQGDGLRVIKAAIKARKACSVHVTARVTILDSATKTGVRCEYDSQPTYIGSSDEI